MKTRALLTTLTLVVLTASGAFAQARPHTINQRQENQKDRLQAGRKDDQLTKAEATRLRAEEAGIRAQEKVERKANGGTLTAGEKAQLNRELNRTSRQIHRARHNDRKPKS